jgi:hypothetical protein
VQWCRESFRCCITLPSSHCADRQACCWADYLSGLLVHGTVLVQGTSSSIKSIPPRLKLFHHTASQPIRAHKHGHRLQLILSQSFLTYFFFGHITFHTTSIKKNITPSSLSSASRGVKHPENHRQRRPELPRMNPVEQTRKILTPELPGGIYKRASVRPHIITAAITTESSVMSEDISVAYRVEEADE